MKTVTIKLPVSPDSPPEATDPALLQAAALEAGLTSEDVTAVVIRRRSLDARARRRPMWVIRADVFDTLDGPPDLSLPPVIRPRHLARPHPQLRPVIVGMGPAGLFAALRFADFGIKCTILDRGAAVQERNLHVRDLRVSGVLDPESNLCFGEGGAGTYSDGKLYTRGKSPRVREVYERLVALGLARRILVDGHPHVGTNRLIPMMKVLRNALLEAGHELLFDACMTDLVIRDAGPDPAVDRATVAGVVVADGREIIGTPVLLATGHSARDTYRMMAGHGVQMQRKPFAIGARVEHPQALIDDVQLGPLAGWASVGAAEYFVRQQVDSAVGKRGVYSFCMCPGGFVLPSPTVLDHLNVNGMSNSNRGGRFANAALVMQVMPGDMYLDAPGDLDDDPDFGAHVADGALAGIALQGILERRAYQLGGGGYRAPAQRLVDFVADRGAGELPERTSYRPGVQAADLRGLFPTRFGLGLQDAARRIDSRQLRGYLSDEAQIIGAETTTSSPVRVLRGDDRQSTSHAGLYPCAEGAGYAGGIVSSAIDGMLSAEAIMAAAGIEVAEEPAVAKQA